MKRRFLAFAWVLPAALIVLGFVIGWASAVGALLFVGAALAILGHFWFVTWGPGAEPNRFHRRDLWQNRRELHRDLRRHRREVRDRLAGH